MTEITYEWSNMRCWKTLQFRVGEIQEKLVDKKITTKKQTQKQQTNQPTPPFRTS